MRERRLGGLWERIEPVSDGAINVVLDACRICYLNNLGYRRTRGGLVCRFCGNRYSIDSLNIGECPVYHLSYLLNWIAGR
jgi:uncharacterized membrane protein